MVLACSTTATAATVSGLRPVSETSALCRLRLQYVQLSVRHSSQWPCFRSLSACHLYAGGMLKCLAMESALAHHSSQHFLSSLPFLGLLVSSHHPTSPHRTAPQRVAIAHRIPRRISHRISSHLISSHFTSCATSCPCCCARPHRASASWPRSARACKEVAYRQACHFSACRLLRGPCQHVCHSFFFCCYGCKAQVQVW